MLFSVLEKDLKSGPISSVLPEQLNNAPCHRVQKNLNGGVNLCACLNMLCHMDCMNIHKA